MDPQPGELLFESGFPEFRAHGGERAGERLGGTGGAVVGLAKRSRAVPLLREVDEVEIARERAGHLLSTIERPRGHERVGRVRVPASRGGFRAGLDHRSPQRFDVGEEPGASVLGDDLTERVADQPHLLAERTRHLMPRGVAHAAIGRLTLDWRCHTTQTIPTPRTSAPRRFQRAPVH